MKEKQYPVLADISKYDTSKYDTSKPKCCPPFLYEINHVLEKPRQPIDS